MGVPDLQQAGTNNDYQSAYERRVAGLGSEVKR